VARDPGRKLGPDDRLIAPALACLNAGLRPVALATAAAAALRYTHSSDAQARHLLAELRRLGPEESLAIVSGLLPNDDLSRLICERYYRASAESAELGARAV
jgi:mannitol-1-phosphate 5-dehydrogenase